MISVTEALDLILSHTQLMARDRVHPSDAVGLYLAQDVASPYPLPFFTNSAMDGYALLSSDTATASDSPVRLTLSGVVAAGANPVQRVLAGQAAQILTGAMLPPGADAVVRQEDVTVEAETIILRQPVKAGANIRRRGEEVQQGDMLLKAGSHITPAAVGVLLGAGVVDVEVYNAPRIGIITTGSEVVPPGETLQPGKIFNSNGATLAAAATQARCRVQIQSHVADDEGQLKDALSSALSMCDILLITGGVSVGRFDYVKEAAVAVGVQPVFWKIKQKPGKPLFFGTGSGKCVFGLPGNPASALTCFYEYVVPCIRKSMGAPNAGLRSMTAQLHQPFSKKPGLTHFLKASLGANGSITILERQGSHMMTSFAIADCLAVVPEETETMEKGAEVQVHLLPIS